MLVLYFLTYEFDKDKHILGRLFVLTGVLTDVLLICDLAMLRHVRFCRQEWKVGLFPNFYCGLRMYQRTYMLQLVTWTADKGQLLGTLDGKWVARNYGLRDT